MREWNTNTDRAELVHVTKRLRQIIDRSSSYLQMQIDSKACFPTIICLFLLSHHAIHHIINNNTVPQLPTCPLPCKCMPSQLISLSHHSVVVIVHKDCQGTHVHIQQHLYTYGHEEEGACGG